MYTEIGEVSEDTIARLKALLPDHDWQLCERLTGEVHQMSHRPVTDQVNDIPELTERWQFDTWRMAIFMRLRPGDHLYRHADDNGDGIHIPVETNEQTLSLAYPNKVRTEYHLEVGKAYHAERSIDHEAYNTGATNRTHLILIMKKT